MVEIDKHPDELLPWFVNGTLNDLERGQVERHLQDCERCRDEVKTLKAIRASVKAQDTAPTPAEFGLHRLLRDAKASAAKTKGRVWWQPALAAAAVVLVIQGVLIANLWTRPPAIVPLGDTPHTGVVLQLRFQPQATEAQIRQLLQETDATLVDGPGALGVYRIQLQGLTPEASRAEINRIARELREHSGVILEVSVE